MEVSSLLFSLKAASSATTMFLFSIPLLWEAHSAGNAASKLKNTNTHKRRHGHIYLFHLTHFGKKKNHDCCMWKNKNKSVGLPFLCPLGGKEPPLMHETSLAAGRCSKGEGRHCLSFPITKIRPWEKHIPVMLFSLRIIIGPFGDRCRETSRLNTYTFSLRLHHFNPHALFRSFYAPREWSIKCLSENAPARHPRETRCHQSHVQDAK